MTKQPLSTPLARVAEGDHPTWVDFCGWHMPVQFTGIVAEHLAVRHEAGLFDISHMGRLAVAGAGADAAVETLLTRCTADMAPGDIRYSFIADERGDILDDLMVARRDDGWHLVVNAGNRQRVVAQIRRAGFAPLLTDRTHETAMLALQGPKSVQMIEHIWPEARAGTRKRYKLWSAERSGAQLLGSRSGYTGEDGFEVSGPPGAVEALWQDLRAAGAAPCGLGARDSLRNEAALPLYGHELREDTSPWELGLAYAVDLDKVFLGRDELLRRRDGGVRQKRVGIILTSRRIARENMPVFRGATPIGMVTSGTWSPLAEAPIAQGYVDASAADPDVARSDATSRVRDSAMNRRHRDEGGEVEIDVRGRREPARIVPLRDLLRRK